MNSDLEDEITSINSIYDDSTLTIVSISPLICALRLPALPSISLRLEFPPDYPAAPPSVLGTQSVGEDVPKGTGTRIVEAVRSVLADVYQPGEPCIFTLVEEVGEAVERDQEELGQQQQESVAAHHHQADVADNGESGQMDALLLDTEPPWTISSEFREKKSVFVARAAKVESTEEAKRFLMHLLATDKKVAKATHNITAWRIRGTNDSTFQDCDDDGETAAGGRVLHLMQLMDVWGVMVVVTRWYGGVQLGPDRFRLINSAAREALVMGGWAKEKEKEGSKKKGRK
ncbi:UPF0029-domain-containing protein [Saccharata proteae CBS 121410]|uniref:UPF0029-domain-containing protein n=1 Tax=Saccharata proteae CBS 121410 TaxID=1314787 RepID=A0A9P4HWW7_9PEZI|nr:UPF0029-domain-containing protein [Saccharata proteae CBS 121410]